MCVYDVLICPVCFNFTAPDLVCGDAGDAQQEPGVHDSNLGSTAQYLTESCQSGAITCLVCISKIKRQNEASCNLLNFY